MDITQPALHQELRFFAQSILKNEEDAFDVVQDVLTHCLSRSSANLSRAYLFKAVRNSSLNRLRSASRYQKLKQNLVISLERLILSSSAQEPSIDFWLQKLPSKQRDVLLLRIKNELSHQEIAEVLGIPLGTVKSRINTAIHFLRKKVKDHHYE